MLRSLDSDGRGAAAGGGAGSGAGVGDGRGVGAGSPRMRCAGGGCGGVQLRAGPPLAQALRLDLPLSSRRRSLLSPWISLLT